MLLSSSSLISGEQYAIPDGQAASGLEQFGEHGKLVGVGRSHRQAGDHSRPAHSHMHPKAVEGLLEQGVLAEGGFSLEAATAVGAGKQARRKGMESTSAKVGLWWANARNS